MGENDMSAFTLRITIKASIQNIYNGWATQEGLEKWFLRSAEFKNVSGNIKSSTEYVQIDDRYEWRWHGYSNDVSQKGIILSTNDKDMMQFTFTDNCIVTIKIFAEREENVLELKQEKIPPDANPETNLFIVCQMGWTFYLANLKSILEGGIDLRNKNEAIKRVINA